MKLVLILPVIASLTGCATAPNNLGDADLCYESGYAYVKGDKNRYKELSDESKKRDNDEYFNDTDENGECLTFMVLGMRNAEADNNKPSTFHQIVGGIDALGSAGHSKTVIVK